MTAAQVNEYGDRTSLQRAVSAKDLAHQTDLVAALARKKVEMSAALQVRSPVILCHAAFWRPTAKQHI